MHAYSSSIWPDDKKVTKSATWRLSVGWWNRVAPCLPKLLRILLEIVREHAKQIWFVAREGRQSAFKHTELWHFPVENKGAVVQRTAKYAPAFSSSHRYRSYVERRVTGQLIATKCNDQIDDSHRVPRTRLAYQTSRLDPRVRPADKAYLRRHQTRTSGVKITTNKRHHDKWRYGRRIGIYLMLILSLLYKRTSSSRMQVFENFRDIRLIRW